MSEQSTELAFVALGSNIEPEAHLPQAMAHLRSLGRIQAVSRVYQSEPAGGRSQPDFLNAAVLIEVTSEPADIRAQLRKIETDLGRVRTEDKYASRTIDLDLVLLGDRVDPEFPLPDPDILIRAHLAVPLAELAPEYCHPITGEALGTIASRLRSGALQPNPQVSHRLSNLLTEKGNVETTE